MKIEVGKVYECQEERRGLATGDLVYVGNVLNGMVTFWKDKKLEHFNYSVDLFEDVFYPYEVDEPENAKPAHYDTSIDTIAFAKANFTPEQVEGFMRINAIKYLQRVKKGQVLEDLKKSRSYIDMLIEMEEGK